MLLVLYLFLWVSLFFVFKSASSYLKACSSTIPSRTPCNEAELTSTTNSSVLPARFSLNLCFLFFCIDTYNSPITAGIIS